MDVSYIMSVDEIFTLMMLIPEHTAPGEQFISEALTGADNCALDELEGKKMAKRTDDGRIELAPVISMFIETLAKASAVERAESGWIVRSQWITLHCEPYPYKDKHYILTPMKGDEL